MANETEGMSELNYMLASVEYCREPECVACRSLAESYNALRDLLLRPFWYCGCGHTNGANLAHCAACGRNPNGEHP